MAGSVGAALDAGPKFHKGRLIPAVLQHALLGRVACPVADLALDTMILDGVSRTERIHVIGEWAVLDALRVGGAVSAETEVCVEDDGFAERASVHLFGPVPGK